MGWQQVPTLCQWDITAGCNLNCLHCRAAKMRQIKKDLDFNQVIAILKQILVLSPDIILALAGGEPLVRQDLREILLWLRKNSEFSKIELLSNGTMINRSNIGWLTDSGPGFNISLEGASAGVNDRIRGQEAFRKAINGISLLVKNNCQVTVRMTYFHQAEEEVEKLLRLLPEIGVRSFNFRYLVPVGNASAQQVSSEQYARLAQQIFEIGREFDIIIGYSDPFPEILVNKKTQQDILNDQGLLCGRAVAGCSMAFSLLYLDPVGIIRACPYFPIECGDAKIEPFDKIWFQSEVLNNLRKIRSCLKGSCGDCQFKFACGGCRGAAWAAGDFLGADPRCWNKY